jgi:alpha-amylase
MKTLLALIALIFCGCAPFFLQKNIERDIGDKRVLLQGFYWESYRHGHPDRFPDYGPASWYTLLAAQAPVIRDGRFDLIWLPPPSYAGDSSAGYNPKVWYRLDNSYGSEEEHLTLLRTLLAHGVEPIADIVINHRDGLLGWAHFTEPAWGTDAVCRSDEAFTNEGSEVFATPEAQRGQEEEFAEYAGHDGTTYAYPAFRDIDHTNPTVRRDVIRYLKLLQSIGYRGWRYDMVHGYHARWLATYNRATRPTFSVGEYDWDKRAAQRGWIARSATTPNDLDTASHVFDFTTFFFLKDRKEQYKDWYNTGFGLANDITNGYPWKKHALTFLENHDTGYRTHEDGTAQEHHQHDSFLNDGEIERAYAYILSHPGVPSVFWKHYFDSGDELQGKIRTLVNARKVAGVHSGSTLHLQQGARAKGLYAAMVEGTQGRLYVRIGGDDQTWQPKETVRVYAQGDGWKIWLALPGNPSLQQAPLPSPLEMPLNKTLLSRKDIPDAWIEGE